MSKKKFLHRYKTIINFLKINKYASFEEIGYRARIVRFLSLVYTTTI